MTRHTIILLLILTVIALGGYLANQKSGPAKEVPRLQVYASVIVGQLLLVRYVRAGLRGTTLRELAGRAAVIDVAIAAAFWLVARFILDAVRTLLGTSDEQVSALLPRTTTEKVLWIVLSIVAGLCEEIIYRGYLQRKLGVIVQAVVFGLSHGYQGPRSIALITVYGLLFGLLAKYRKSLVPGMLAHAWTDIYAGLF